MIIFHNVIVNVFWHISKSNEVLSNKKSLLQHSAIMFLLKGAGKPSFFSVGKQAQGVLVRFLASSKSTLASYTALDSTVSQYP